MPAVWQVVSLSCWPIKCHVSDGKKEQDNHTMAFAMTLCVPGGCCAPYVLGPPGSWTRQLPAKKQKAINLPNSPEKATNLPNSPSTVRVGVWQNKHGVWNTCVCMTLKCYATNRCVYQTSTVRQCLHFHTNKFQQKKRQ